MSYVQQVSVFLENKSGRLAEVTRALAGAGVNLGALSIADTSDFGILRFICDQPDKAAQVLREAGFSVGETEVLAVEVPHRPGGLADLVGRLLRRHTHLGLDDVKRERAIWNPHEFPNASHTELGSGELFQQLLADEQIG